MVDGLVVRAEEFDYEAADRVRDKESDRDFALKKGFAFSEPDGHEEGKHRFVKLHRMDRERARVGFLHEAKFGVLFVGVALLGKLNCDKRR